MQTLLSQWLALSWLECAGFVLTLAGIALAARNRVLTWPLQMLAGVIYVVLFCQYQLFGEAALNALYVVLAVYGWRAWQRGSEVAVLPISRMGRGELACFWGVGVTATVLVAQLQLHFLPTALPWLDSAVFVFGVLAQWLQARRKLWNWPVWIVLDLVAAGIYFYKALTLTGLLYLLLTALAAYGWWDWRRLWRGQGGA